MAGHPLWIIGIPGLTGAAAALSSVLQSWIRNGGVARPLEPCLPALESPLHAAMLAGREPSSHGIVADGRWSRGLGVALWGRGIASACEGGTLWDDLQRTRPGARSAVLAVPSADSHRPAIALDTRMGVAADGGPVRYVVSRPATLHDTLAAKLGREFPVTAFDGPLAGADASAWLLEALTALASGPEAPDLIWTSLPWLRISAERWGPGSPQAVAAVEDLDGILAGMADAAGRCGATVLVLGAPGVHAVTGALLPNVILRQAGLLHVSDVRAREMVDATWSPAFAWVDRQVAHVRCRDGLVGAVADVFRGAEGVARVLHGRDLEREGIAHPSCGDVVLVARPDRWFAWHWWTEPGKAPPLARQFDQSRKPGADPMELFINPRTKAVDADLSRIRGSFGNPEAPRARWPSPSGAATPAALPPTGGQSASALTGGPISPPATGLPGATATGPTTGMPTGPATGDGSESTSGPGPADPPVLICNRTIPELLHAAAVPATHVRAVIEALLLTPP